MTVRFRFAAFFQSESHRDRQPAFTGFKINRALQLLDQSVDDRIPKRLWTMQQIDIIHPAPVIMNLQDPLVINFLETNRDRSLFPVKL